MQQKYFVATHVNWGAQDGHPDFHTAPELRDDPTLGVPFMTQIRGSCWHWIIVQHTRPLGGQDS